MIKRNSKSLSKQNFLDILYNCRRDRENTCLKSFKEEFKMKNSKLVIKPLAEATEEEQKQLIDAVQQMLNAQKAEKVPMENDEFEIDRYDRALASPHADAVNARPIQSRSLDTPTDDKYLIEVVRRVPTTEPVHAIQVMSRMMIDHSYRLGYRDGIVDAYHNLEVRGIKVPPMSEIVEN